MTVVTNFLVDDFDCSESMNTTGKPSEKAQRIPSVSKLGGITASSAVTNKKIATEVFPAFAFPEMAETSPRLANGALPTSQTISTSGIVDESVILSEFIISEILFKFTFIEINIKSRIRSPLLAERGFFLNNLGTTIPSWRWSNPSHSKILLIGNYLLKFSSMSFSISSNR